MASNEMKLAAASEEVRRVLQPMFSRPKLRSRLLSKPPFRFIHDVVVAIIDSTEFPASFFTDEELDSSYYKDNKQAKLAFLDKIIAVVNAYQKSHVEAESRNIVAGVQPAATLSFLVAFGKLANDDSIDHAASIQQFSTRIENVEEETKVDEETKEDFAESKAMDDDDDTAEEAKEDELAIDEEVCKTGDGCPMTMADAIDRIIESASIIEYLQGECEWELELRTLTEEYTKNKIVLDQLEERLREFRWIFYKLREQNSNESSDTLYFIYESTSNCYSLRYFLSIPFRRE